MDSPFSVISNFFTDGIFGNLIRFLFDRIFGSHFTTNINISNLISLKNGSFKDLQLDPVKVNKKHFKNSPIKLFSGSIGTLSIKFPSFNALLTESIEVSIDKVDLLFYIGDIDYSTAENDILQPSKKEGSQEDENPESELQNLDKNLDVYKKIINKILLNMQLKLQNICVRVVNGKPYKDIRLPIAPCLMLKLGDIDFKRDLTDSESSQSADNEESGMIFTKHHKYDISISSITAHMMSNYELKTNEYQGETTSGAVFPFTYPNEFHPSTFFVCACKKKGDSSRSTGRDIEPIHIKINFSNDKSKSIDVNIPHIEVMLDFLKIKYLSRYFDKAMELKKLSDYKKGLNLFSKPLKKARKESMDINPENMKNPKSRRESEILSNVSSTGNSGKKIKIAGYMIDTAYFQSNKETSSQENETESGLHFSQELKLDGMNDLENDITPENLLDTSNMRIKLQLSSFHAYLLKSSSAFMDTEFKRYWLFGSKPQSERPTFNKRIPINYFQIRLKRLEFTHDSKESNTEIQFNSLTAFDVCRVESPLKYKMNQTLKPSVHNQTFNNSKMMSFRSDGTGWNKSDIFQSFKRNPSTDGQGGNLIVGNSMNSSDVFELAQSQITKEFLGVRELNKQLIDWELDSKNHHFCINVLFKLSKAVRDSFDNSSEKKSSQNAKFSEDAVIHTPLNGGPVNPENEYPYKKIIFRVQNKNGKRSCFIELTQIYINFYPSLVNDFNALLHDASTGYVITENWYWDQNQGYIKKWEEEMLDEKTKSVIKPCYDEKKINQVIEDYEATQQTNLDLIFSVQLIKVVLNMENVSKDSTTCFCGFTSLFTEKPSHSNPLFTKEFIIFDIESIGVKAIKVINSGTYDPNVKNLALQSSVILQSINVYVPTDLGHDGQILLTCLLSLKNPRMKNVGDSEEKRIIPNILVKIYEDNGLHDPLPTKILREDSDNKDGNPRDSPFKKYRQSLNISDSEYIETFEFYENFQKHMNKNFLPDMKYLNNIKAESSATIAVTLPLIEVFTSKKHLQLVNNFFKNLKARIKEVDAKMQDVINEEKKFFSSMIHKAPTVKKPTSKAFQLYLDQLCIYSYLDEIVESKYKKFINESKKKGNLSEFINNSIQLDASVRLDESMLNKSIVAQGVTNAIKMVFPSIEFIEAAKGNLSVLIRHIESIFHINPKYGISLAHSEVYDLTIIDRSQEIVLFGSYDKSKELDKKEYIEDEIESYNAIVYKQSRNNYSEKKLTIHKAFKNEEFWKNIIPDYSLFYIDSSFKVFEFKKSNILSFGMFAYTSKERTSMDFNLRISELNFRSDFNLECVDLIRDMLQAFDERIDPEELNTSNLTLKRNSSLKKNNPVLLRISLENIMIDINPYYTHNYYSMNLDKTVDHSKSNVLYYSGMRTVLAIESIELRLSKLESDMKFDSLKISELDVLMRNSKNMSNDESLILRSSKTEGNLFDNNYLELAEKYKFAYRVIKLSGFLVENYPNRDISVLLEKVKVDIHCDTLASIENQIHLIMFLLGKKSLQKTAPLQSNKKSILKNKYQNVKFEENGSKQKEDFLLDIKYDHFEKIKLDQDDDCLVVEDDFEDVEKDSPSKLKKDFKNDEPVNIDEDRLDGFKEIELDHTFKHFPTEVGFIQSNISFFREKYMHNFNFNGQVTEKKSTIQILEIEVKVFSGYIFEGKEQKEMLDEENQIPEETSESISLKISDITLQHSKFKPNLSYQTNCEWRISSSIKNIELIDLNSKGKQNKIFSKLEETDTLSSSGRNLFKTLKESKITAEHMVNFLIESYERKPFKTRDLRIFLGIHPIELNIGKPHYNFFKKFSNKMQQRRLKLQDLNQNKEPNNIDNKSQKKTVEKPYFIPLFVIAPIELKMKVNLDISVISFDLFKDCTLIFDTFAARGIDHTPQLKAQIIEYYIKNLKKQTGKFVTDLPLLRNVKNLSKATLNVFYSPYSQFVDGGNITLGLKDGIVGFVGSVANESTNLFTFFTGTVENIATEIRSMSSRR